MSGRTVTNLASYNYYNFLSSDSLKEKAIQTLRTYGVGPCGPPGFYGTQDVHMRTEADIAAHIGVPSCIVYAQAFSTISSVIPAFSKRGDVIVADKGVNYAVRKGIQISRSTVRWFEHNDLKDCERVLAQVVREGKGKPLTRRFIVTEALFEDIGDMSDLPALVCTIAITYALSVPPLTVGGFTCLINHQARAGLHSRDLLLTSRLDRAEAPLQVPPHPRRDLVLRRSRPPRQRPHLTPRRRP